MAHLLTRCDASHARIGKYPHIWPQACGIGRETKIGNNPCFEWNKMDDSLSQIKNGRKAMQGEVPYVVYIDNLKFRESGAIYSTG